MSKIEIDEEMLEFTSKTINKIAHEFQEAAQIIGNKEEDIFKRYLQFVQYHSLIRVIGPIMQILRNMTVMGFDLKNEIFQTDYYNEMGWNNSNIKTNPFFINNEEEAENFNIEEFFNNLHPNDSKKNAN